MQYGKETKKTLHNYAHERYLYFPYARWSKNVRKKKQVILDNWTVTGYNVVCHKIRRKKK